MMGILRHRLMTCLLASTSVLLIGCSETPESLQEQGLAAMENKDYHTAMEKFTEAIQLSDTSKWEGCLDAVSAYRFRGFCYMELKKFELALSDFEEAIRHSETVEREVPGAFDFSDIESDLDLLHQARAIERAKGGNLP